MINNQVYCVTQPLANDSTQIVDEREYISAQGRVQVDCHQQETLIRFDFKKPFNGVVVIGNPAHSPCRLTGNGTTNYELRIRHNATECESHWDERQSSIVNTLSIRYHSSLETGADVSKTIMCRLTVGDLLVGRRRSSKKSSQPSDGKPTTESRPFSDNDSNLMIRVLSGGTLSFELPSERLKNIV